MTLRAACARITLFEGPDGGGKSYAAKAYAAATGARYVHLGPFPAVQGAALGRLYVEALLPALLGYQDVVLDRCWVSEVPYGHAFRGGRLRLEPAHLRMLARLAWRGGAVAVICLPGYATAAANWRSRRAEELLRDETQLRAVYDWYEAAVDVATPGLDLHTLVYDYKSTSTAQLAADVAQLRPRVHALSEATAGNPSARVAIVGDAFGFVKSEDALYQWPFASFSRQGCSRWFTEQLLKAGIGEDQLFWVNADQLPRSDGGLIEDLRPKQVFAFGTAAATQLAKSGVSHRVLPHPQAWKRFHHRQRFEALDLVRDALFAPQEAVP